MRKDILFEDDIIIEDGDLVVGDSDRQHIEHILVAAPGHYKQNPLVGANITQMLSGPIGLSEKQNIKKALQSDGYNAKNIIFNEGGIEIDAE